MKNALNAAATETHRAPDVVLAIANEELVKRMGPALEATKRPGRTRDEFERTIEIVALGIVAELRSVGYAVRIKDAGRGWGCGRYDIARA